MGWAAHVSSVHASTSARPTPRHATNRPVTAQPVFTLPCPSCVPPERGTSPDPPAPLRRTIARVARGTGRQPFASGELPSERRPGAEVKHLELLVFPLVQIEAPFQSHGP